MEFAILLVNKLGDSKECQAVGRMKSCEFDGHAGLARHEDSAIGSLVAH